MTITTVLIALAATLATGGGGYLLGLALGRRARQQLLGVAEKRSEQVAELERALSEQRASTTTAAGLREEMRSMLAPLVGEQQANAQELRDQIGALAQRISAADRTGENTEVLRQEINRAIAPMLRQDRESKGLREMVRDMLGPLMERERRAQGLERIAASERGREQLPKLLDTIAKRGGFAAVLLSDEVGLPLAASAGARNAEVLAGVSSLILSLADRVARTGGPMPNSVLVRDNANQLTLHRIFTVGEERFLVTAVSKSGEVSTTALDPALAALEDALVRRDAA